MRDMDNSRNVGNYKSKLEQVKSKVDNEKIRKSIDDKIKHVNKPIAK